MTRQETDPKGYPFEEIIPSAIDSSEEPELRVVGELFGWSVVKAPDHISTSGSSGGTAEATEDASAYIHTPNSEEIEAVVDTYAHNLLEEVDHSVYLQELEAAIDDALATLGERNADIIRQSFGLGGKEPASNIKLAEQFGVSRERIRQLIGQALGNLALNEPLRGFAGKDETAPHPIGPKVKRPRPSMMQRIKKHIEEQSSEAPGQSFGERLAVYLETRQKSPDVGP